VGKSRHFCLKKFGRGHDIPLGYLTNNFENLLGLATSIAVQENNKKRVAEVYRSFLFCACFYSKMKRKMKKPFQKNGFTKYPYFILQQLFSEDQSNSFLFLQISFSNIVSTKG
jgi:hypothetical protein